MKQSDDNDENDYCQKVLQNQSHSKIVCSLTHWHFITLWYINNWPSTVPSDRTLSDEELIYALIFDWMSSDLFSAFAAKMISTVALIQTGGPNFKSRFVIGLQKQNHTWWLLHHLIACCIVLDRMTGRWLMPLSLTWWWRLRLTWC